MFGRMPLFLNHLFFLFLFLLSNHHEHTLFILISHVKAFFALLLAHAWAPKACVEDLIIYYIQPDGKFYPGVIKAFVLYVISVEVILFAMWQIYMSAVPVPATTKRNPSFCRRMVSFTHVWTLKTCMQQADTILEGHWRV